MFKILYKNKIAEKVNEAVAKVKTVISKPITLQLDRDNEAKMIDFSTVKAAIEANELNRLFSIYQKILNCDLNLSGSLETRRDALLALPITFKAEKKEQLIIEKVLENFEFDEFLRAIANDIYYGISLQNIVYELKDGLWLPKTYNTIFPTLLNEEIKDKQSKLYFKSSNDKKLYVNSIDQNRLIIHKHNVDNSILQNNSIAYKLLWSVILKHTIITLNLEFFDKAAVPPLIVKMDDLTDTKKADELFAQMMELKSTSVGMFTKEMEIDTLKFNSKADFDKAIDYFDKLISKFITGGTLSSSNENTGSQALGNVHNERLMEKVRSDSKLINKTVSKFFNQILALNLNEFKAVEFSFILPEAKNHEEMKVKSETVKNLSDSGYVIDLEDINKMFNMKKITFKKQDETQNNHIEFNSQEKDLENTKALEDEIYSYVSSILNECNSWEELEDKLIAEFNYMNFEQLEKVLLQDNIKNVVEGTLSVGNDKK